MDTTSDMSKHLKDGADDGQKTSGKRKGVANDRSDKQIVRLCFRTNHDVHNYQSDGKERQMTEVWKDIKGFEGKYAVSNFGNVKRLECYKRCGVSGKTLLEEKPMRFYKNHNGYYRVCLCKDGKRYFRFVHLLVAEAFLPKKEGKPQINHIDGNKKNNDLNNLEWVTSKENHIHASETGLKKSMKVTIVETGEVFNSIGLCAKRINGCKAVVAKRLSDYSDVPYKGYRFRYCKERSE